MSCLDEIQPGNLDQDQNLRNSFKQISYYESHSPFHI